MPRPVTPSAALSSGQLAKRWGVGMGRIQGLVASGLLPGAFRIPAAGRHGEAMRIPLASVLEAEQQWSLAPQEPELRKRRPRRNQRAEPTLKHFPELTATPASDAESRASESC